MPAHPPFTISTIKYKVVVYAPAERVDTFPLFLLYHYVYSVGALQPDEYSRVNPWCVLSLRSYKKQTTKFYSRERIMFSSKSLHNAQYISNKNQWGRLFKWSYMCSFHSDPCSMRIGSEIWSLLLFWESSLKKNVFSTPDSGSWSMRQNVFGIMQVRI
jgi:hypothetical protein